MVILFAIIAVVTAVYTLYIIVLHDGIKAIDTYIPNAENPKTCFSILIPFRNEAENIVALLDSIAQQEYPKDCLLYTSPSPRDQRGSRMPSSA